jgi:hypothetical protein
MEIGLVFNLNYSLKIKVMTTKFKSIDQWLKSQPSEEEKTKILILVNRGATSKLRRDIWEKERYVLKLQSFANHCKKLGFTMPEDHLKALASVKKEIETLKKELPIIPKKEKKEKPEEKTEEKIKEPAASSEK